jgi:hypothetical protein
VRLGRSILINELARSPRGMARNVDVGGLKNKKLAVLAEDVENIANAP